MIHFLKENSDLEFLDNLCLHMDKKWKIQEKKASLLIYSQTAIEQELFCICDTEVSCLQRDSFP